MSSPRGDKRGFWHMTSSQEKGMAVMMVLMMVLCMVSIAIKLLPYKGIDVCVTRMDSLQIIPTVQRSDTFTIDINSIDEYTLATHPMVGDSLAHKIFTTRIRYGGFIDARQMADIFSSDEKITLLLSYMVYDTSKIVRYDINVDDEDMLAEHPYITRPFARSVVEYRQKVGLIQDYSTLQKIKYFPRSKAQYLERYINFEKTKEF